MRLLSLPDKHADPTAARASVAAQVSLKHKPPLTLVKLFKVLDRPLDLLDEVRAA